MSTNIYDTANQLERDLRETEAYVALKAAYEAVKANPESNDMFKEFQGIQIKLQQKQMSGEEILEEEIKEAQEMAMKTGENETIKVLMEVHYCKIGSELFFLLDNEHMFILIE